MSCATLFNCSTCMQCFINRCEFDNIDLRICYKFYSNISYLPIIISISNDKIFFTFISKLGIIYKNKRNLVLFKVIRSIYGKMMCDTAYYEILMLMQERRMKLCKYAFKHTDNFVIILYILYIYTVNILNLFF